jgi:SAM-dependent methyltransferase
VTTDPTSDHARRQRKLLSILGCPRCHAAIEVVDVVERYGCVADAELNCIACGNVGVVRGYRPSFHPEDLGDAWVPKGVVDEGLALDTLLERIGSWTVVSEGLLGDGVGASITGVIDGCGVVFELGTHSWSGRVRLSSGDCEQIVDLYSADTGSMRITMSAADAAARPWSVTVVGGGHPARHGDQVILRGVRQLVPAAGAARPEFEAINLGNPYPARFGELVTELSEDAIVLDIGGGDRRYPDRRVFNLEYLKFPRPDLYGSGLNLPFRTGSIDLVLSQAVLEHVPDPKSAVDEFRRVLKPGGRIYAEFAFMQPLHAVPFHFFNITPHGAALLFVDFAVDDTGVFGGLSDTLAWIFRLVDAERRLGSETAARVLGDLARLDADLDMRELEHIASAVYVEATRPA